jgi:hypothetical protein
MGESKQSEDSGCCTWSKKRYLKLDLGTYFDSSSQHYNYWGSYHWVLISVCHECHTRMPTDCAASKSADLGKDHKSRLIPVFSRLVRTPIAI